LQALGIPPESSQTTKQIENQSKSENQSG